MLPPFIFQSILDSMNVARLVRGYQERGHEVAKLDPLGVIDNPTPHAMKLAAYGLSDADLTRDFTLREHENKQLFVRHL